MNFVRQMFRGFSLVMLCIVTIPAAVFACVVGGFVFLPLPANIPEPRQAMPSQPSHIYDVDGREIAVLQRFDQNIPVKKEDIPLVLKQALISAEDRNFYKHKGVDPRGTLRALWADIRNESSVQGGSTITQQYVKLAYVGTERTITRKVREAILAGQLDRQIDKEEILYRYLSLIYFGDGAYGIGAAAESYFHKPVNQLTVSEAATLVGVIPAPSARAPRDNPTTAEALRKQVLGQMLEERYLTPEQHAEELPKVVWLESQGPPPGPATVIHRPQKAQTQYPYFVDYVKKYLVARYGEDAVYTGGLRVQTTLSPKLQAEADKTVSNALSGTSAPLEMALASVEPQTGFVRALVGGRDFTKLQVNLALGGCPSTPVYGPLSQKKGQPMKELVEPSCRTDGTPRSGGTGRQPGSSYKPFVLAAAYEAGIKPSTVYPAPSAWQVPGCSGTGCVVNNYEGEVFGSTDLKNAMAHSINTVFSPLIRDIGTKENGRVLTGFTHTAELAKRLGVSSSYYAQDFHGIGGQYALGTIEVSPLDMASAYGVFANRGIRVPATPVVKVVDTTGKVFEDNSSRSGERVLDETIADNVTDALRAVVTSGTGRTALGVGHPVAGKTGTAENYTNAWFVGYTPTLSTSVWMGYSDTPRRINYKGNTRVAGGTVPTTTWTAYMKKAMEGVPVTDFTQPAPIQAPVRDVLGAVGSTIPLPIAAKNQRSPKPTPSGGYDRSEPGTPAVEPPTTTTTTTPTSSGSPTGGGLQPLGAPSRFPEEETSR